MEHYLQPEGKTGNDLAFWELATDVTSSITIKLYRTCNISWRTVFKSQDIILNE